MVDRMEGQFMYEIDTRKTIVETAGRVMTHFLSDKAMQLKSYVDRMVVGVEGWLVGLARGLETQQRLLKNLDPTRVLKRGYSIVKSGGTVIKDVSRLELGTTIAVQFASGRIEAKVNKLK